jgi:hypothetical protein
MRKMRSGTQPPAGTMSPRPVSAPVRIERVVRLTASPTLLSAEIGWGGVAHPMIPAWKC